MLILGLAGSPRNGSNSEILLDEALLGASEAGAEAEKAVLAKLKISPCIGCGSCEKTGECIIKDDMQKLYEKIEAAHALILSSPIYFYGLSAWAKAVIDRAQALWSRRYIMKDPRYGRDKKGFLIAVAATEGGKLFLGPQLTAKYFFDAAGFVPAGELLVRGVQEREAVKAHEHYLRAARLLGRRAAGKE